MATGEGSVGSVRHTRPEKTRRGWTEREEEVLLAALKELVANGWKSDNGFRPGYIGKLEQAMRKEFPNTDLKGTPHITSRLTSWKKNYSSLVSMLNRSGVGFNSNGDWKVEANPEQWEQIYSDSNASKIRGKSWPLFEGWKEVFGKDRATGENAEDVMDAVNDLMEENVEDFMANAAQFVEDLEAEEDTETEGTSTGQSKKGGSDGVQRKGKNKTDPRMHSMCQLLDKIHRDTNARLKDLASRFGFAANLGQARKEVFSMINKVPGLNLQQNFKACDKLLAMPERLEFFIGLPVVARQDYVFFLLTEDEHKH